MQGILIVDKPMDWTSFDVVAKLRGVLGTRKLGHSGTLDPMATGVLPVFCGGASKAVDLQLDHDKAYRAVLRLGQRTDTGDITGTVLETAPVTAGERELQAVLPQFVGKQMQVPPMYSAVKVNGQKLYELARKGQEVARKPRHITILELELLDQTGPADFLLRCRCSKGTYIRTLCHDLGQALGCGGTMSSLRRTMAAGFTLKEAATLEDVQAQGESLLLPTDSLFADSPILLLKQDREEKRVRCGNPITMPGIPDGTYRIYGQDQTFLCLSRAENGTLTSIKNFFGA